MATFAKPTGRVEPASKAFVKFFAEIGRELFGSYHPERHYMRGKRIEEGSSDGDRDLRRR